MIVAGDDGELWRVRGESLERCATSQQLTAGLWRCVGGCVLLHTSTRLIADRAATKVARIQPNKITVWEAPFEQPARRYTGSFTPTAFTPTAGGLAATFDRAGRLWVVAHSAEFDEVQVFDESGEQLARRTLRSGRQLLFDLEPSAFPDAVVVSTSGEGTYLLRLRDGKIQVIVVSEEATGPVAFSPSGCRCVVEEAGELVLYSPATGTVGPARLEVEVGPYSHSLMFVDEDHLLVRDNEYDYRWIDLHNRTSSLLSGCGGYPLFTWAGNSHVLLTDAPLRTRGRCLLLHIGPPAAHTTLPSVGAAFWIRLGGFRMLQPGELLPR